MDDLFAYNVYLSERTGQSRWNKLRGAAVGFVFFASVGWWQYWDSGETALALIFFGTAIVWAVVWVLWLGPLRQRQCLRKAVNKLYGDEATTSHEVTLTETGVQEAGSKGKTFHSWDGIRELTRTDTHLFIFVGPVSAHVIPLSAFPSRRDADTFFTAAQDRKARSQPGSVAGRT